MRTLLTAPTAQPKMAKSAKSGVYLPYILHLAPAEESGYNTCPMATDGCKAGCLNKTGHGRFDSTQNARIQRTIAFYEQRAEFFAKLHKEVNAVQRKAIREGKQLIMRLNGTSDIRWEMYKPYNGKTIFQEFPNVIFYDYTKIPNRRIEGIPNYSLTFSRGEKNHQYTDLAIANGLNVAVVFRNSLPATWNGLPVIDGDVDDLRFLDPKNVIVGLKAKGRKAKEDTTGFVVD